MAVRIVLFDLGGVVLDWDPARLYSKIFETPQERDMFLADVCTMAWHNRHDAGESFAGNAKPLIADYPHYEDHILAWGQRWFEMFDGYVDGTPDLIARLQARHVPLYALSNMPADPWEEMLDVFPLLRVFRHAVISGEIGMVKPAPVIYHHALAKMDDPDPAEVLFVDDRLENIEAADALGFLTHHFTTADGLEATLRSEGLI
ncbi:HAD family hydrolase [Hyphomonas pacifica]|uniref:HAD family hydrolase n=1 Tax=Hyphomonas pacifica TaxID=1280941 RepID=UPI000DBF45DE|nr:HAD family phosphatase [Hyphomonas pacifica]RAN36827.1 hypothetical protein HY11_11330 [Hyphomonas pacifica]